MALIAATSPLRQAESHAFEITWNADDRPMLAGIYRCVGCQGEIALPYGACLPRHSEHHHQPSQAGAAWRLVVATDEALGGSGRWARPSLPLAQRLKPLRESHDSRG